MFNSDHIEPVVRRKKVIKGCTSVALNQRCRGKKSYVMFNLGCLDPGGVRMTTAKAHG